MKQSKIAKQTIRNLKATKKQINKCNFDHLMQMIRTDSWDEVDDRTLLEICDNYRIEGMGLLDATHWIFSIAEELERLVKERHKDENGK